MLFIILIFLVDIIKAEEQFLIIINTNLGIHDDFVKTHIELDSKDIKIFYTGIIDQYPASAARFDHLTFRDQNQYQLYEHEVHQQKHQLTCFDSEYKDTQIENGINSYQKVLSKNENITLVLDNSQIPCNGFIYESIEPWITVLMQFGITKTYFYFKIFLIITILFSFIILTSAIILTWWEIKKLEQKMRRRSSFPRILQKLQIK
ncbi:unnamed protein product (macronuclear) [Paramecium tetraurelia]|uniref:Transmembrane protein n=1 Tax=Paramecium tetraurelia TaxID=5888 RepID=A0CAF8_PARTE|nr:uncharacterized protein GSPATT00036555001 [Paramecium tetraurelia]CAK67775.1 unnamed protein product [Paramecium tetraurelia]|eukprot:XP_001435172.1 hypothetical protein (macronuclear) [Paramecium tetraurelia strain d4-2]